MSNPKFEITNPEAIKLIADIKSGVYFTPVKAWITQHKWYFVGGGIGVFLLVALIIGTAIGRNRKAPIFLPPDIGTPIPTQTNTVKSDYEWIKENIVNYGTELPDPVIPPFDNAINLESANI